jgi:hypothetical protein
VVVVACSDDGGTTDQVPESSFPVAVGEKVAGVLTRSATDYAVDFKWRIGALDEEGQFFLKRSGTLYRWDEVWYAPGELVSQGSFEALDDDGLTELRGGYSCAWNVRDSATLNVDCPGRGGAVWSAIGLSAIDEVASIMSDRTILGERASCFTTRLSHEYCLGSTGVLLYFKGSSGDWDEEIEAVSISIERQDLLTPTELAQNFPQGRSDVPIGDAGIPSHLSVGRE